MPSRARRESFVVDTFREYTRGHLRPGISVCTRELVARLGEEYGQYQQEITDILPSSDSFDFISYLLCNG